MCPTARAASACRARGRGCIVAGTAPAAALLRPGHLNPKAPPTRIHLLALAIAAWLPAVGIAQSNAESADDEDLKFEESSRNFGFVSGASYQCLPEADRIAHDRAVLRASSGLVQLFGSDRAFFYAAALGAGTGMSIDKAKCSSYIADFRAAMKSSGRAR